MTSAPLWIFKGMLAGIADAEQAPEETRRSRPGITTGLDHA